MKSKLGISNQEPLFLSKPLLLAELKGNEYTLNTADFLSGQTSRELAIENERVGLISRDNNRVHIQIDKPIKLDIANSINELDCLIDSTGTIEFSGKISPTYNLSINAHNIIFNSELDNIKTVTAKAKENIEIKQKITASTTKFTSKKVFFNASLSIDNLTVLADESWIIEKNIQANQIDISSALINNKGSISIKTVAFLVSQELHNKGDISLPNNTMLRTEILELQSNSNFSWNGDYSIDNGRTRIVSVYKMNVHEDARFSLKKSQFSSHELSVSGALEVEESIIRGTEEKASSALSGVRRRPVPSTLKSMGNAEITIKNSWLNVKNIQAESKKPLILQKANLNTVMLKALSPLQIDSSRVNSYSVELNSSCTIHSSELEFKGNFIVNSDSKVSFQDSDIIANLLKVNGCLIATKKTDIKTKIMRIFGKLFSDYSFIKSESFIGDNNSKITIENNSRVDVEGRIQLHGKTSIDNSLMEASSFSNYGDTYVTASRLFSPNLSSEKKLIFNGGAIEADMLNLGGEYNFNHLENKERKIKKWYQKGSGVIEGSEISVEHFSMSKASTLELNKTLLMGGYGQLAGEARFANKSTLNFDQINQTNEDAKIEINESEMNSKLAFLNGKAQFTGAIMNLESGYLLGETTATKLDLNSRTVIFNQADIEDSNIKASDLVFTDSHLSETEVKGENLTIPAYKSTQMSNVAVNLSGNVSVVGSLLTDNKTQLSARAISVYERLNTSNSYVTVDDKLHVQVTGKLDSENSEFKVGSFESNNQSELKKTIINANQDIIFKNGAKTVVNKGTIKTKGKITHSISSATTGSELLVKADSFINEGSFELSENLIVDVETFENLGGTVGGGKDLKLDANKILSNFMGAVEADNIGIRAGIGVNLGYMNGHNKLTSYAAFDFNLGVKQSYCLNSKSFISMNSGFFIPSLPTSIPISVSKNNFIYAGKTLASQAFPSMKFAIDFGFKFYDFLPHIQNGIAYIWDLKKNKNSLKELYKNMRFKDLLPTFLKFKEIALCSKELAKATKNALHTYHSSNWDVMGNDYKNSAFTANGLLSYIGETWGARVSSETLSSVNFGVYVSQNTHCNDIFSANFGFEMAAQSLKHNTRVMLNQGAVVGGYINLSGQYFESPSVLASHSTYLNFSKANLAGYTHLKNGQINGDNLTLDKNVSLQKMQIKMRENLHIDKTTQLSTQNTAMTAKTLSNEGQIHGTGYLELKGQEGILKGNVDAEQVRVAFKDLAAVEDLISQKNQYNNFKVSDFLAIKTNKDLSIQEEINRNCGFGITARSIKIKTDYTTKNSIHLKSTAGDINLYSDLWADNIVVDSAAHLKTNAKLSTQKVYLSARDSYKNLGKTRGHIVVVKAAEIENIKSTNERAAESGILQGDKLYLEATKGDIANYGGEIRGAEYLEGIAKTGSVINKANTTENAGKYDTIKTFTSALISGGVGKQHAGTGLLLQAGKKVINIGSVIHSESDGFVSANEGVESTACKNTHIDQVKKSKTWYGAKKKTEKKQTTFAQGEFIARGVMRLRAEDGSFYAQGTQFVTECGTEIYADEGITLEGLKYQNETRVEKKQLWGLIASSHHSKQEKLTPSLIYNNGKTHLESKNADVCGTGLIVLGDGDFNIKAPQGSVWLQSDTLTQRVTHKKQGLQFLIPELDRLKALGKKGLANYIAESNPLFSKIQALSKSDSLLSLLFNSNNVAIAAHNLVAKNNSPLDFLSDLGGISGLVNPSMNVSFNKSKTKLYFETAGPGAIYQGNCNIEAWKTIWLALDFYITESMFLKASEVTMSGKKLHSSFEHREIQTKIGYSPITATVGDAGLSFTEISRKNTYFKNLQGKIGENLHIEADSCNIIAGNIDSERLTGETGVLSLTSEQNTTTSQTKQRLVNSSGRLGFFNANQKEKKVNKATTLHVREGINHNGTDYFEVGKTINTAAEITSDGQNNFSSKSNENISLVDRSKRQALGVSGNIATILSSCKAPDTEQANIINTVNISSETEAFKAKYDKEGYRILINKKRKLDLDIPLNPGLLVVKLKPSPILSSDVALKTESDNVVNESSSTPIDTDSQNEKSIEGPLLTDNQAPLFPEPAEEEHVPSTDESIEEEKNREEIQALIYQIETELKSKQGVTETTCKKFQAALIKSVQLGTDVSIERVLKLVKESAGAKSYFKSNKQILNFIYNLALSKKETKMERFADAGYDLATKTIINQMLRLCGRVIASRFSFFMGINEFIDEVTYNPSYAEQLFENKKEYVAGMREAISHGDIWQFYVNQTLLLDQQELERALIFHEIAEMTREFTRWIKDCLEGAIEKVPNYFKEDNQQQFFKPAPETFDKDAPLANVFLTPNLLG